ncbi:hypothetical protein OBBRIDRAFT_822679 [Obba rivulosa]|uniref:Uncharacterized protein n=1 Tax=Obba rivulosa TaxID=1052685 RepID=A0A8E2DUC7_9APHY|nr:hypothetical protein OBBRIDRAFT_822679 [Obba rivulosa]
MKRSSDYPRAPGVCGVCNTAVQSLDSHWRRRHQSACTVKFPAGTGCVQYQVARRGDGRMHCPRCSKSYEAPMTLQSHTWRNCGNTATDRKPALEGRTPLRLRIPPIPRVCTPDDDVQFIGVRTLKVDGVDATQVDIKPKIEPDNLDGEEREADMTGESRNKVAMMVEDVQSANEQEEEEILRQLSSSTIEPAQRDVEMNESPDSVQPVPADISCTTSDFTGELQYPVGDDTTWGELMAISLPSLEYAAQEAEGFPIGLAQSVLPPASNDGHTVGSSGEAVPSEGFTADNCIAQVSGSCTSAAQAQVAIIAPQQPTPPLTPAFIVQPTPNMGGTLPNLTIPGSPPPPSTSNVALHTAEHSDATAAFLSGLSDEPEVLIHAFRSLGFETERHLDALCRRSDARWVHLTDVLRREYGVSYADCVLIEDGLDSRREALRSGG